jgi:hypothetical protein
MMLTMFWGGLLLMVGCGSPTGGTQPPAASIPPETAETAVSPIITPESVVVPATPTVVPEPPTPAPEPTATGMAGDSGTNLEAGIEALLRAGFQPRIHARYPSPDGTVEAQVQIYDCTSIIEGQEYALDVMRIVNLQTQEEIQEVDSQLQSCGGLGGFGLGGLFWSPSGRFFYYTEAREGTPDGCGYWSRPISRFDSTDGTTQDLGGGPQSSDGSRLATWQDGDLVVWEIDGGEGGRSAAAVPEQALGPIVWSPDDQYLVYLQADQFCSPTQTTLVLVRLDDMFSEVLLASDSPAFQDVAWYGPEQLVLADGQGGRQFFSLANRQLTDTP